MRTKVGWTNSLPSGFQPYIEKKRWREREKKLTDGAILNIPRIVKETSGKVKLQICFSPSTRSVLVFFVLWTIWRSPFQGSKCNAHALSRLAKCGIRAPSHV